MSKMKETASALGLSGSDYEEMLRRLNREPTLAELGIFGAMWSEHCSYRSSKDYLRRLPSEGKSVIEGPGENAGVVDIGDGMAVVFKMESHNHPSYIDPYQGAATGVGGIMRDVFTMGARPVALLNALRFGAPEHQKTRHLVSGVVAGIGDYGNCVGIPTVGGEVDFDESYNGNILVNAMCVGVARQDGIFRSAMKKGHKVFYVGARTGRDGLHGAMMASASFRESEEEERGAVQIGDPFMQKLLLEACLELMEKGAIASLQDMGAAGLTSSSVEMASKGGTEISLDLDKVPCREENMTAYEIMLSESQERMLLSGPASKEAEIRSVCEKWDLSCAVIGETGEGNSLKIFRHGKKEAEIRLAALADPPPRQNEKKKSRPNARGSTMRSSPPLPSPENLPSVEEALLHLLGTPALSSRRWVWEQYDRTVMGDTLHPPGGDAALVRIHGTKKALALVTEATPRYLSTDVYEGAKQAVAEAWRNLSAVGSRPLAITDCLNFGNPEKNEIMESFARAIEGMGEAARCFSMPVVSGNVSFYNETESRAITPTPAIGAVGLVEDCARVGRAAFLQENQAILLVGEEARHMGCTIFAQEFLNIPLAHPPVNLEKEKKHGIFLQFLLSEGLIECAHDLSAGGLAIAAAEMALAGNLGATFEIGDKKHPHRSLFSEDQARYLIACPQDALPHIEARAQEKNIPLIKAGETGGDALTFAGVASISLKALRKAHESWFPSYMKE